MADFQSLPPPTMALSDDFNPGTSLSISLYVLNPFLLFFVPFTNCHGHRDVYFLTRGRDLHAHPGPASLPACSHLFPHRRPQRLLVLLLVFLPRNTRARMHAI